MEKIKTGENQEQPRRTDKKIPDNVRVSSIGAVIGVIFLLIGILGAAFMDTGGIGDGWIA